MVRRAAMLVALLLTCCDDEPAAQYPTDMQRDMLIDAPLDMRKELGQDAARDLSEPDMADLSEPDLTHTPRELDFERMQLGRHSSALVSMRAFSPHAHDEAPDDTMSGVLVLTPSESALKVVRDDFGRAATQGIEVVPPMTLELSATPQGELIPKARTLKASQSAWWTIAQQGRAWREPEDQGWVRVTMPISLVEPFANCTVHGFMMLLYDPETARTTDAYYQFSQETCLYFKADLWGWYKTSWTPGEPADEVIAEVVAHNEVTQPRRPLRELGIQEDLLLDELRAPEHVTTYGVSWQGVHYQARCTSRAGDMPDCAQIVLPSYSTAKSLIAGLGYLARRRTHPEVDVIKLEAWPEVALTDLLSMTSGHYDDAAYMADEAGARMLDFFLAHDDAEKLEHALSFPAQPTAPWVYQTSQTFLAVRLMQRALGEDFFGWLIDTVFAPMRTSQTSRSALRTLGGPTQHFGGYGSFWTPDDVVRLGMLLQDHASGVRDDVLDVAMTQEVLQRGPEAPYGERVVDGVWYHRGFWALEVSQTQGFPCDSVIAFMSGFGGITVALLPNGAVYYVFGDGDEFVWLPAARELAKLGEFCPDQTR